MIYRREEYLEESPDSKKYPVKTIEQLSALGGDETRYLGRVSLAVQTGMGVSSLPISFEIPAADIHEAFRKFEVAADAEIENAKKELQGQMEEMRRKAQSRIVTPGEIPPGGIPPGAMGGMGKLTI